jgi:hypothetical protein
MGVRSILVLLSVFVAGVAHADGFFIYRDLQATSCVGPSRPELNTVYVFHYAPYGARGSMWAVQNTTGMILVGWTSEELTIGEPFGGLAYDYEECLAGQFPICELKFFKFSGEPIPGCNQLTVINHPQEADILALDCALQEQIASGGRFTFDPDNKPLCNDCVIAVESKTWGSVKALFR